MKKVNIKILFDNQKPKGSYASLRPSSGFEKTYSLHRCLILSKMVFKNLCKIKNTLKENNISFYWRQNDI